MVSHGGRGDEPDHAQAVKQDAHASSDATVAQAGRDAYANVSVHIGDVNLRTGAKVRTRYRHQVERIAPSRLEDRDAELAELTAFCTDPTTEGHYRWWRAGAWAGKSALLSTFVLTPPPGVRVVSFFITARLAGQADRAAFADNVLEQLLTILGEEPPPFLNPATREPHLLGLLADAAGLCRERGEHLVLVVDGLDEDRGVTTGHDSHSIAALLPARPVEGLRIIVAGRPDPPIPGDVPEDHPLHDPAIVRVLEVSQKARALRTEMERDLKRLLTGSWIEQDLLGLLVAAGGGLTAADLAWLTKATEYDVRDHLHTVTGRSFTRRNSDLGSAAEVYLLAHEDLQVTALQMLGENRLAEYRERIHGWAAHFAEQGWPADTPDYLLRGYHTMLLAVGDLARATGLCTALPRHDRLFDRTGGDNAALAQVVATIDAQAGADVPDLVALSRLAVHRDQLSDRNTHIPPAVAGLWVRLGQIRRATALAHSIPDPYRRSSALVPVAEALIREGRHEQARELLDEAVLTAARITHHDRKNAVLGSIAPMLAELGDHDRAVEVARSITSSDRRAPALAAVAGTSTGTEPQRRTLREEALAAARRIIDPFLQCIALGRVTDLLVSADDPRTGRLIAEAVEVSESIADPYRASGARASVVRTLARTGRIAAARAMASTITDAGLRGPALVAVAEALIERRLDGADELLGEVADTARAVDDPGRRSSALVAAVHPLVRLGDRAAATGLLGEATEAARAVVDADQRGSALVAVVQATVEAGIQVGVGDLLDEAIRVARMIVDLDRHDAVLEALAKALARDGHHGQAVRAAEGISDRGDDSDLRVKVLMAVAEACARAGDDAAAVRAISAVPDARTQIATLVSIARALAERNQHDRAAQFLRRALSVAAEVGDPVDRDHAVAPIAEVLADIGHHDEAFTTARSVLTAGRRRAMFIAMAKSLVRGGDQARGLRLLDDELETAKAIENPALRDEAVEPIALAQAEAGYPEQAIALVRTLASARRRIAMRAAIAEVLVRAGEVERARAVLTGSFLKETRRLRDRFGDQTTSDRASPLLAAGEALALVGASDGAIEVVSSVEASDARDEALASIAGRLVRGGHVEHAITAARWISETGARDVTLQGIAEHLAMAGRYREAIETVLAVDNATTSRRAWESIAEIVVANGSHHRVIAIVELIVERPIRRRWLLAIADKLVDAGHAESAAALVDDVTDPARALPSEGVQDNALVVSVLARAGRHRQAVALALRDPDLRYKSSAMTRTVIALAKAGRYEDAELLIRRISAPSARDGVRSSAAEHLADALEIDSAVHMIESITDDGLRFAAYAKLVRNLSSGHGIESAVRSAAQTLQSTHWAQVVADICAFSNAASSVIFEEYSTYVPGLA